MAKLAAGSATFATAYLLGQQLSDLCRVRSASELDNAFVPHYLVPIEQSLNDLASVLPSHAAKSVARSITWWRDVVAATQKNRVTELVTTLGGFKSDAPALRRKRSLDRPIASAKDVGPDNLVNALPRQGALWRSVLTGEKDPLDLLTADDYIVATKRLMISVRALLQKAPKAALIWISVFFLLVAVGAFFLVHAFAGRGTDQSATSIGALLITAAAWIAALWKVISARLGSAVRALEKPLWGASLDYVSAEAISIPPVGRQDADLWSKLSELAIKKARQEFASPSSAPAATATTAADNATAPVPAQG